MNIEIRNATIDDIEEIWNMVYALAVFENDEKQVITSIESYKDDFAKNAFEVIIAYDSNSNDICGMMLFFNAFSTWKGRMVYLDDFFVKEKYRRLGVGQLLFDYLINIAKQRDASMVKWQVLDWNENAVRFYEKNNAFIDKDWWNCGIRLK